jgi:hypothetical protein
MRHALQQLGVGHDGAEYHGFIAYRHEPDASGEAWGCVGADAIREAGERCGLRLFLDKRDMNVERWNAQIECVIKGCKVTRMLPLRADMCFSRASNGYSSRWCVRVAFILRSCVCCATAVFSSHLARHHGRVCACVQRRARRDRSCVCQRLRGGAGALVHGEDHRGQHEADVAEPAASRDQRGGAQERRPYVASTLQQPR